ncbi:MAG: hypothetical protein IT453_06870 [Planctomycetes bacterium]|nr:hypothetical protein [Planctomycetota bacterium]
MKKLVLFAWLLAPVAGVAYHYGPGQDRLRDDEAFAAVKQAQELAKEARETAAAEGDAAARSLWAQAEQAYAEALAALPNDRVAEARTLRLEQAKAQMFVSQLPEARRTLEGLVEELAADASADPKLLDEARDALANAQYYTTWLMRLEGAPREEWEPEIEASRQNYKLVAEHASDAEKRAVAAENVESSIRLARMDLKDLQGLPLPSQ